MNELDAFNLALLILRVGVGLTLAAHGYNKFFGGGRIPGTAKWFDSMGMRPGTVHAVLAASTELGAGVGLAIGLFTALCGAAFVALMFVAYWTVHRVNGFFIVKSGWEYNFVLALVGITVATLGPGEWSLDDKLGIGGNGLAGLLIAGAGGLAAAAAQLGLFYRPPAKTES